MRPSWQEYFLSILDATALRASCDRGKSAAVIVRDNRILATGYVGAPSGLPSCDEVGHKLVKRCELPYSTNEEIEKFKFYNSLPNRQFSRAYKKFSTHCIRTVHSEINAIVNCARNGVSTLGATLYCSMTPCPVCGMAIIQAGIVEVIVKNPYQKGAKSIQMFNEVGIKYTCLNDNLLY
jgi:dCMP deaminase